MKPILQSCDNRMTENRFKTGMPTHALCNENQTSFLRNFERKGHIS